MPMPSTRAIRPDNDWDPASLLPTLRVFRFPAQRKQVSLLHLPTPILLKMLNPNGVVQFFGLIQIPSLHESRHSPDG